MLREFVQDEHPTGIMFAWQPDGIRVISAINFTGNVAMGDPGKRYPAWIFQGNTFAEMGMMLLQAFSITPEDMDFLSRLDRLIGFQVLFLHGRIFYQLPNAQLTDYITKLYLRSHDGYLGFGDNLVAMLDDLMLNQQARVHYVCAVRKVGCKVDAEDMDVTIPMFLKQFVVVDEMENAEKQA